VQVSNSGEAAVLVHVAEALAAAGLPAADIGAISPYRAQVRFLPVTRH
jgi:superfamily I DNA and/or RNA helicase